MQTYAVSQQPPPHLRVLCGLTSGYRKRLPPVSDKIGLKFGVVPENLTVFSAAFFFSGNK